MTEAAPEGQRQMEGLSIAARTAISEAQLWCNIRL